MPDEPNTLNPTLTSVPPTDPASSAVTPSDAPTPAPDSLTTSSLQDPQKMVDEALTPAGTAAPGSRMSTETVPASESTPPVTPELQPEKPDTTVPMDLLTPPPTPITPPTPSAPLNEATPEPSTSPLTDEMPLAFAGAGTNLATDTLPPLPTAKLPTQTPTSSPLPSMPGTPLTMPDVPKKKKKPGKILGALLGFLMLVGGIGGGYWYYTNYLAQPIQVAEVTPLPNGSCPACDGGHQVTMRNGKCVWKAALCDGGSTSTLKDAKVACTPTAVHCGKTPDGCGGFCINAISMTCDDWLKQECNFTPSRGANIVACGSSSAVTDCHNKGCDLCFDKTGECTHFAGSTPDGLCAITNVVGSPTTTCGTPEYYFCEGMTSGTQNGCQVPGKPKNPNCYCGTTQVDTPGCGFTSHTDTCGCGDKSPNPSGTPTPTFACSGLTKDKATPKIGDKVTFTCAGAATPAGSVTLSYQFRYRKDAGAWTSLTAAANKTTLTVDTAATYDVQCKACGAVPAQAKSTCDPEWTTL